MTKRYNIQVLRAIAAYAVVGHHILDSMRNYLAVGRFTWNPQIGSFGVDVFFVISGFVMMMTTARRNPGTARFVLDRVLRLVPIYWLFTLVAAVAIAAHLKLFGGLPLTPGRLATSLLFLPDLQGDEVVYPILFPGWTLNYEMMFYLVFSLFLGFRREWRKAALVTAAIGAAMLTAAIWPTPLARYLGRTVVAGFALGVLCWPLLRTRRAPAPACWAMVATGIVAMVAVDALADDVERWRLAISFASALIVGGAVMLENGGVSAGAGWVSRQGDASYALYLVHPFAIQLVGKLALVLHLTGSAGALAVVAAVMLVGAGIAGTLAHLTIEMPLLRALKRAAGRPPSREFAPDRTAGEHA